MTEEPVITEDLRNIIEVEAEPKTNPIVAKVEDAADPRRQG
jgi:hypothetical protein